MLTIATAKTKLINSNTMGNVFGKSYIMGMVFGKIVVETPKYTVAKSGDGYEIRQYPPAVAAEVTYDPSEFKGDKDGGFGVLAKYIGVFGKPENQRPEKIAMTSPVITTEGEKIAMTSPVITTEGEKIAMTSPVITKEAEKIAMTSPVITTEGEKIAMTSPVITTEGEKIAMTSPVITAEAEKIKMTSPVVTKEGGGKKKTVTMQFLLPEIYKKAEDAPRPTDERVVIREEGGRKYGVVTFSGKAGESVVSEKVKKLTSDLERDGFKIIGEFVLARYNPPWTLPPFRTNEVMIPVE